MLRQRSPPTIWKLPVRPLINAQFTIPAIAPAITRNFCCSGMNDQVCCSEPCLAQAFSLIIEKAHQAGPTAIPGNGCLFEIFLKCRTMAGALPGDAAGAIHANRTQARRRYGQSGRAPRIFDAMREAKI